MFVWKRNACGADPGFSPRRLLLASLIAASWAAPAWTAPQVWVGPIELPADPCMQNPNGPGCLGQWSGPYTLGAATPGCTGDDDIGHAALIPTGSDAGKVLVWTECDYVPGHTSWIWDADAATPAMASASFQGVHLGPFCAGHAWMVDGSGNARLLIVGGLDHEFTTGNPLDPCGDGTNPPFAVSDTSWFDPLAPAILPAPANLPTHGRSWYPSTIVAEDVTASGAFRCLPLTVGGSSVRGGCCLTLSHNWYVLPAPYIVPSIINWTSFSGTPQLWQEYPRVHYLSSNRVTTTGNDVVCPDPIDPFTPEVTYGGNPVRVMDLSTQTDALGKDPNEASPVVPVGAMHMGNAVLMHTLKPDAEWPTTWPLGSGFAAATYDLDRVLTYGGVPYQGSDNIIGMNVTAELGASGANPASWTWKRKEDCPTGSVFGSLVVLPDGSLLRVGGQNVIYTPDNVPPGVTITYRSATERFFPKQPPDVGVWKSLALRSTVSDIERGYHSVAGLLKSGAVFLGGGRKDDTGIPFTDPEDTAEVFKPPYFFQGTRPSLGANQNTIHYGEPFCVYTRNPEQITHASLIGICSTTHHFDYGQRYVELLVTHEVAGLSCGENHNLAILPPPQATMAPTNYYLLFLVDNKGRPSNGVFVQLSH